jgi:hypothetical protein
MSLGIFGVFLAGILIVMCLDRNTRLRAVVTGLAGLMLGVVIAGSNGVLVEPSQNLVDGVRSGLTAVGRQISGDEKPPAAASER